MTKRLPNDAIHRTFIGCWLAIASVSCSFLQAAEPPEALKVFRVKQDIHKALVQTGNQWEDRPCFIKSGVFIVQIGEPKISPDSSQLIKTQFVTQIQGNPKHLFVRFEQLAAISHSHVEGTEELLSKKSEFKRQLKEIDSELIVREYISNRDQVDDIPKVIQLQRDEELIQAWEAIQSAKRINDERAKKELPLYPQPYFAEAMLWQSLSQHEKAIASFVIGGQIATKNGTDIYEITEYYKGLALHLKNYLNEPYKQNNELDDTEVHANARYLFAQGFEKFRSRNFKDASDYFSEAILLRPNVAGYWFYRAICFNELGQTQRARHDAVIGVSFERNSNQRREASELLTSAQGPGRLWLEKYRNRKNIPVLINPNAP